MQHHLVGVRVDRDAHVRPRDTVIDVVEHVEQRARQIAKAVNEAAVRTTVTTRGAGENTEKNNPTKKSCVKDRSKPDSKTTKNSNQEISTQKKKKKQQQSDNQTRLPPVALVLQGAHHIEPRHRQGFILGADTCVLVFAVEGGRGTEEVEALLLFADLL